MSIKISQSNHKEVSLGFWLTLLIVYLQYIYPLQSIGSHFSLYGYVRDQGLWIGYVWIRLIPLLFMSGLTFYAGLRLRRHFNNGTIELAINTIAITGPIWQLIDNLVLPFIFFPDFKEIGLGFLRVAISLIFAILWIVFLTRSKKIKSIYSRSGIDHD